VQHSGLSRSHKDGDRCFFPTVCIFTAMRSSKSLHAELCMYACARLGSSDELSVMWHTLFWIYLSQKKTPTWKIQTDLLFNCSGLLIAVWGARLCFTRVKNNAMHRVIFHFPFFQYELLILILSVLLFLLCPFISIRCWFLLYLLMLPEDTFWNNRIQMSLFEELVFCLLSGGRLCSFHSRKPLITTLSLEWRNLMCCLYSLQCDPHSW